MNKPLSQWLVDIEALHPAEIELGLERLHKVYQRLPALPEQTTVFTVAGTNGKGSVVKSIEALALACGKRVGVYMSPHLLTYNERVQLQQQPVSDDVLVAAFEQVEAARGDVPLTYFEFGTLAALVIFSGADLDWVVLEVGLGGRLDAVNIVDPQVAVITSIDLDHEAWLGDTREKIGFEKAGIVRSSAALVCGDPSPPRTVKEKGVAARQAYWRGGEFDVTTISGAAHVSFLARDCEKSGASYGVQRATVSAPLPVLAGNFATAVQAVAASGQRLRESQILSAARQIRLAGRQQLVSEQPYVMLDVGHNPQAARALAERIERLREEAGIAWVVCLVGMLADKNHAASLAALLPQVDCWWPVSLNAGYRACAAETLAQLLREAGAVVAGVSDSPVQGYQQLRPGLQPDHLLVVFGSFHTVADVIHNT